MSHGGDIDPRRLETFRVVATLGQVSAAARALHLSQPAVTAQIRQLEDECGAPLFVRTARGMVLNDLGRALLSFAQRARQILDEAAAAVQQEAAPGGELVLAASTTLASYVLPPTLVEFRRAHPKTGVRLEVGNTTQVLAWVKEGRVPLGLVEGHARAPGVRLERFLSDELLPVVAGPQHELPHIGRLADLSRVPLVWREPGSGTRAVVERALKKAGSSRRAREGDLQLGGTEAIKTAVALGAGLGFLSRFSIRRELAAGVLRTLAIPALRIERVFSWVLPGGELGGLHGRFKRFADEAAARRV
ncbi:MAG: selenium metabolism-associated LysR family transcriptional regulator [Myxococcales bacterium]